MANALTELLYDGQFSSHYERIQKVFADEHFKTADGLSMPARVQNSYAMLRRAAEKIGKTSDVVRDPQLLLAFYDWSCIHAPDLLPLISGHYNLTAGSLLTLGEGRADLKPYLDDLDTAASVGVLLINEYACGSNVAFLETTATYDHPARSFLLDTPHPGARKFMPNVGAEIPRVTIIAARLVVDGVPRGVFPFVLRLRDATGTPAAGVTIMPMPDKPFFPMDNAVISFSQARVPFEGWLSSGIAGIDEKGEFRFSAGAGPHDAFRLTTSEFTFGRVALSSAAVAGARASLLIFARYVQTREIQAFRTHRKPMLEFQNVQRSLFGSLATVYACTFLANTLKTALIQAPDLSIPEIHLAGIVAKSYLVTSAQKVAQESRERCGAHSMFSASRIPDYLGLFQGLLTAEGDIQVLRLTAGRYLVLNKGYSPQHVAASDIAGLDDEMTWLGLFRAREGYYYERTASGLRGALGSGTVFDRWNRNIPDAMQLADAYASRWALESFLTAIEKSPDAESRTALYLTAKLFALDYVTTHAGFYLADGYISRNTFKSLDSEYTAVCHQLMEYLPLLVEAFGIDEDILDTPITSHDRISAWEERSKGVAHLWKTAR
jgi:acyl-CoA oxidase